jgi:biopolymer transport protein ExbD
MRRFSQRSALVTLSEINITPLLDLAFVLLIIFVITTPLLEQSIPLTLYQGGRPDARIDKRDIRTVEVTVKGTYYLEKQQMRLAQIEAELTRDYQANRNLIVRVRADETGLNKHSYAVLDMCQRIGITKFNFATEPPKR